MTSSGPRPCYTKQNLHLRFEAHPPIYDIADVNVNVRLAFTVAFTFRSAFLALNAAANACERESMRGCARGVR